MYSIDKSLFPQFTQSFVNWNDFPYKMSASAQLEKSLNAALLRMDPAPFLSVYDFLTDGYYFDKLVLPTEPLPTHIGDVYIADDIDRPPIVTVNNRDVWMLKLRKYCSYFYVKRGEVHFVMVSDKDLSRNTTPPIFPPVATKAEWSNVGLNDNFLGPLAVNYNDIEDKHDSQNTSYLDITVGRIRERRAHLKKCEFFYFSEEEGYNAQVIKHVYSLVLACTTKLHDRMDELREVSGAIVAKLEQVESAVSFAMFYRHKDRVADIIRITGEGMREPPTVRDLFDTLLSGILDIRVPL